MLGGTAALAISASTLGASPAAANDMSYWQGWYGGLQVGAAFGEFDGALSTDDTSTDIAYGTDEAGFAGGIYLGYNHRRNGYVYGIEADILFPDINSFSASPGTLEDSEHVISDGIDVLASVRGRLGYMAHENLLVYGTAGFAWASVDHRMISFDNSEEATIDLDGFAPVVGAGVEWAINDTWGLRAQGLYYFFDENQNTEYLSIGDASSGDFGSFDGVFTLTVGLTANLSNLFGPR
ncbi:outer membrane protein [Tepidamorphus sp. 3E244]|uniref:outer membrane protein n=1 Tax=Tepidamorphus sp. 3E244 TaxID=3385498 RepID=UPI0038FC90C8